MMAQQQSKEVSVWGRSEEVFCGTEALGSDCKEQICFMWDVDSDNNTSRNDRAAMYFTHEIQFLFQCRCVVLGNRGSGGVLRLT